MTNDILRPVHTLVLVGPHGAGKTTLARGIGRRLGWRVDDEIGARHRLDAVRHDAGAHALIPDAAFDRAVSHDELARDAGAIGPRVVETWHPGNFAYVRARNPGLARELGPALRRSVEEVAARGRILVQPLTIDRAAAVARRSERGPVALVDFFLEVGRLAAEVAREWGLDVAPVIATDRCTVEAALALITGRVGADRPTAAMHAPAGLP